MGAGDGKKLPEYYNLAEFKPHLGECILGYVELVLTYEARGVCFLGE